MNRKALFLRHWFIFSFSLVSLASWGQMQILNLESDQADLELVRCVNDCLDLTHLNLPASTANIRWIVTPLIGDGLSMVSEEEVFTFCTDEIGLYQITLEAFDADFILLESTSILVEMRSTLIELPYISFINPDFTDYVPFTPYDVDECQRVCPGDMVVYGYPQSYLDEIGFHFYFFDYVAQGGTFLYGSTNGWGGYDGVFMVVLWEEEGPGSFFVGEGQALNLPGNYLTNTVATGNCLVSVSGCVEIMGPAEVEIISYPPAVNDIVNICLGESISFSNAFPETNHLQWYFGNGISTDELNPTYTYTEEGTYTVLLRGSSDTGCGNPSDRITVIVENADGLSLDCLGTVCPGDTVSYAVSPVCPQLEWMVSSNGQVVDGGDVGDASITVVWNGGIEGVIEVNAEACALDLECGPMETFTIPILSGEAEIEGPAVVCIKETYRYQVPLYEGTEYEWMVQGAESTGDTDRNFIDVTWAASLGTGRLIVHYESCFLGCSGTDTLLVERRLPFHIEGQQNICPLETYNFLAVDLAGDSISSHWQLRDSVDSLILESTEPASVWNFLTPNTPGNYTLVATPEDASLVCQEFALIQLTVPEPPPVPQIYGSGIVCPGESQLYQAIALPAMQVQWTVIDGDFMYQLNTRSIQVIWGDQEPRQLLLRQRPASGIACYSIPDTLDVITPASAEILGAEHVCVETVSTLALPAGNGNTYFDWQIIPANAGSIITTAPQDSIEILWHQPGDAIVQLNLCGNTLFKTITVHEIPEPQLFYDTAICAGTTTLVQTSELLADYTWMDEAGDVVGTTPTLQLGPGNYQVHFTSEWGCGSTRQFSIQELPSPEVFISTPQLRRFCDIEPDNDLYATATQTGLTYQWYVDGIPIATDTAVIHVTAFGDYRVVVTDQNGCTGISNKLTLEANCDFPSSGEEDDDIPLSVDFDILPEMDCMERSYLLQPNNYTPISISWNFDDPTSSSNFATEIQVSHHYTEPGFYTVIMKGTFTHPLLPGPQDENVAKKDTAKALADFSFQPSCAGEPMYFTDLSRFVPITSIAAWDWDFGDPTSGASNFSSDIHPTHIYDNPGAYTVALTITEMDGCTSTATQEVTVVPPPEAFFEVPAANCALTAMRFVPDNIDNIVIVQWDFGDPASGPANASQQLSAYHVFAEPGNYIVTLSVANIAGCTDTYSQAIIIEPNPLTGNITPTEPEAICQGDSVLLTAPPGGVAWNWSTGDTTEQIAATLPGRHTVTVTGADGCTYIPEPVQLQVIPSPAAQIVGLEQGETGQVVATHYETMQVCEGTDVILMTDQNTAYAYAWSSGDGMHQIYFTETRGSLLPAGTHEFTVTVTDQSTGCVAVDGPFIVEVVPSPATPVLASDPSGAACNYEEQIFYVSNASPEVSYLWSNGEDSTSITVLEPGNYTVTATNPFGCEAISDPIVKKLEPNLHQIPTGCHTVCRPAEICVAPIAGVVGYQWYFNGVPLDGATEPTLDAEEDGSYYLEVTTTDNCTYLSDALDLTFFDGAGNYAGQVYFDQNHNGEIDAGDSLLLGIDILLQLDTAVLTATTDSSGYLFSDLPADVYQLELDLTTLPPGTQAMIWQVEDRLSCNEDTEINWLVDCLPTGGSLTLSACPGDSVQVDNQFILAGEEAEIILTNIWGCDSILQVLVTELLQDTAALTLSTCPDTPVIYEGIALNGGDQEVFHFTNQQGCDSMVTVTVEALRQDTTQLELWACANGTALYANTEIPAGTTESFLWQNSVDCDSTVIVQVQTLPVDTTTISLMVCPGQLIDIGDQTLEAGDNEWFQLQNQQGCDSIVNVQVDAYEVMDYQYEVQASCPNEASGLLELNTESGTGPFQYSLDNGDWQSSAIFPDLSGGEHQIRIEDGNGCQTEEIIFVETLESLQFTLSDQVLPCGQESLTLSPNIRSGDDGQLSFRWNDGTTTPELKLSQPGLYSLEITNNCETQRQEVRVEREGQELEDYFYLPNAFSPNDDGVNDRFRILPAEDVVVLEFKLLLFDRWGNLMYRSSDWQDGWNGDFRARPLDPGVYVYYVNAKVLLCGQETDLEYAGDVALMR